jgi:hypothetical protein
MIKTAQDAYLAGRQAATIKLSSNEGSEDKYMGQNEVYHTDSTGSEMLYDISKKKQRQDLLRRAKSDILYSTLSGGVLGGTLGGLGGAYLGYTPRTTITGTVKNLDPRTGALATQLVSHNMEPKLDTSYMYKGLGIGAGAGAGLGFINSLLAYRTLKDLYGQPGDTK